MYSVDIGRSVVNSNGQVIAVAKDLETAQVIADSLNSTSAFKCQECGAIGMQVHRKESAYYHVELNNVGELVDGDSFDFDHEKYYLSCCGAEVDPEEAKIVAKENQPVRM